MTRDIIRMAREAGVEFYPSPVNDVRLCLLSNLERFAALVAAAERDRMVADGWRQCAVGQHTSQFCGEAERLRLYGYKQGYAVGAEAEREACVKICENIDEPLDASAVGSACAAAIRARGKE